MRELALTGFKDFWPQDDKNAIFFGPWCFADNHKYKFWDQENFELAPSPWKSPQDIFEASLYIDSLIDRIIPPLSEIMNNFHGVKYSERFWKIYILVWLIHWLGHCYDRYKRLEQVEKIAGDKLRVKILKESPCHARNFWDYMRGITEGHYHNLLLMSDIIRNGQFNSFVPEALGISNIANMKEGIQKEKHGHYFKDKAKNLSKSIKKCIKAKIENYVSSSLHLGTVYGMSILDKLYLQCTYDPFFLFKRKDCDRLIAMMGKREDFLKQSIKFDAQNEFERIVEKILLRYIPDALLTLYSRKRNDKPKIKIWIGNDI